MSAKYEVNNFDNVVIKTGKCMSEDNCFWEYR